ncbi:MAG: SDR family oxidoreductase [Nitrospirota bacterium]
MPKTPRFSSDAEQAPAPSPPRRPAALVTGGSGGIGRAVCLTFAQAGWKVGVHYHQRREEAERTAGLVKDRGGESLLCRADIRDGRQVERIVKEFVERWERLDVLVCNAGQASDALVLRMSAEQWASLIEINLTGTFHCLRAAGPVMARQRDGAVVVVTSFSAFQGQAGQAAYAASKAGLLGLARTAAREWGRSNVRVNAICPGWQRTELAGTSLPDDPGASGVGEHVLGRLTDLDAVAQTVFHLALARDTSGQVWNCDSRILWPC